MDLNSGTVRFISSTAEGMSTAWDSDSRDPHTPQAVV